MEHRICDCHCHRQSLRVLGYKTQGINGKLGKTEHSTYVIRTITLDWDMQNAGVNVRIAHYNLQEKFYFPITCFLQQRAVLVSSSRM